MFAWLGGICLQPDVDCSLQFPVPPCLTAASLVMVIGMNTTGTLTELEIEKILHKQMSFLSISTWLTSAAGLFPQLSLDRNDQIFLKGCLWGEVISICSASANSEWNAYTHLIPSCKCSQGCVLSTKETFLAQFMVIPLTEEISWGGQIQVFIIDATMSCQW